MAPDAPDASAATAHGAGWTDLAISEMDEPLRRRMDQSGLPWMNSLGFCTIYEQPGAERIRYQADEDGVIRRAAFYREQVMLGVIRVIRFVGYDDLTDAEVRDVVMERRASAAAAMRLLPAEEPGKPFKPGDSGTILLAHDVIAELPATGEAYLQALGRQKRQQLPRYWRRLERDFPGALEFRITEGPAIRLESILELVGFNQSRMASRGRGDHRAEETQRQQRRFPLTEREGLLCELVLRGRVVGGTFNFVRGGEAFLIIPAHDPALEHLNIGNVCLWKTIEHLISRGAPRYHLFWGKKAYKTQFLGRDHPVVARIVANSGMIGMAVKWRLFAERMVPRGWKWLKSRLRPRAGRRGLSASGEPAASDD